MLSDTKVDIKIKLAALWTSIMFLYVYADYFGLYVPGSLNDMIGGRMPPFGAVTQSVLVGTSLMLAIPALMIFLSIATPAPVNRWLNIVFGAAYALIELLTMPGSWVFYIVYSLIEIALCMLAVWYAWRWPKPQTL